MTTPTTLSLKKIYSGKVRDLYEIDEKRMLMVASDRLSAFDVILEEPIPEKGKILTAISNFWFDKLKDLHDISAIDLQVFGEPEPRKGTVIRSAVDAENQTLVLSIKPDQALPLTAYQQPVTVDLFKGLPLTSSL